MDERERELSVTLTPREDWFGIRVYDEQSGADWTAAFPFSPDEHPGFDEEIGAVLYFWLMVCYGRL